MGVEDNQREQEIERTLREHASRSSGRSAPSSLTERVTSRIASGETDPSQIRAGGRWALRRDRG